MKKELNIFLTALEYYTRIPCGRWIDRRSASLHEATRYLPVIGWIAGLLSGVILVSLRWILNTDMAILLSMAASVLLTGAFHEDGLADFCDGFGGGWTKDRILEIMKDSRTGTYGVVGLVLMLLAKFLALREILLFFPKPVMLLLLLVTAHAMSRFTAASFIITHQYVRLSADSKAKPVAEEAGRATILVGAVLALLPFAFLVVYSHKFILLVLLPLLWVFTLILGRYFNRWIGGYTGDCLGAAQQLSELLIYLAIIPIWKFT